MLLGELLFSVALLAVFGATVVGLVYGLGTLVAARLAGRDLMPQPEPGSLEWDRTTTTTRIDTSQRSLLTDRTWALPDPVVTLAGVRYRVTRLRGDRFLVTAVAEGRRMGTFELDGNGRHQEVLPDCEEAEASLLVIKIAVLSSLVRYHAA